jgi:hypothetical protein
MLSIIRGVADTFIHLRITFHMREPTSSAAKELKNDAGFYSDILLSRAKYFSIAHNN